VNSEVEGMSYRPFHDKAVEAVFAAYPEKLRDRLMGLRELIFSDGGRDQ